MRKQLSTSGAIRILSAACVLAMAGAAFGQPEIGPQIRIDVKGTTFASNETSMASSDPRPLEAVGVWNDWRRSGGNEVINMGVAVTNDGGQTWEDFLIRPPQGNQTGVEGDPMTAYDNRTGTLWVAAIAFGGGGGVYVAKKKLGLNEFEPSVMSSTRPGADKCWMAAGRRPNEPDSTRLYIALNHGVNWSDDMGQTWTDPRSLGSGIGFLPRVGPNGELYIAYWDFGTGVLMSRSFDGGQNFELIRIATRLDTWGTQDGSRFVGNFRCPAISYLAVDPNDGTLYAVWSDKTDQRANGANIDLFFRRSEDRGDTWSEVTVINGDNDIPGDQFFPWLEVDSQSRLHIMWLDSRNVAQNDNVIHGFLDAYYAISEDRGETWDEFRLTPKSWDCDDDGLNRGKQFIGDYCGLAVGEDRVYPCYLSSQNGDTDIFAHVIELTPRPLKISLPDGPPRLVAPSTKTDISVRIVEGSEKLVEGSAKIHYRFSPDDPWDESQMAAQGGDLFIATLPGAGCDDEPNFYFSAKGDGGSTVFDPRKAPDEFYSAVVGVEWQPLADDFETDKGWAIVNRNVSEGGWVRVVPKNVGDGSPPEDFDGSGKCYVTGAAQGVDLDGGPTRLISKTLDLSKGVFTVSYAYWFTGSTDDTLKVHVSNNAGETWVLVISHERTTKWETNEFNPADFVELTDKFQVRFAARDLKADTRVEAGIDAFRIDGFVCDDLTRGDTNCDGSIDLLDVSPFILALLDPDEYEKQYPDCDLKTADTNEDGSVDLTDIESFIELLLR